MRFSEGLAAISRDHALITHEGRRLKFVDKSTNGTFVNGRPIDRQAAVNLNDVLSLSPKGPVFRHLGDGRLDEYE